MISVFCDICGKMMESDFSETVQVSFNSYSLKGCVNGYKMKAGYMEREGNDMQLCKGCADRVVKKIDDMYMLAANKKDGEQDGN